MSEIQLLTSCGKPGLSMSGNLKWEAVFPVPLKMCWKACVNAKWKLLNEPHKLSNSSALQLHQKHRSAWLRTGKLFQLMCQVSKDNKQSIKG